ncbi:MAG: hypothetical protein QOH35_3667 [Acidobacteriaceae bacterium]|nr:hypothetical protein [Acidobacteriaceae bacterium]
MSSASKFKTSQYTLCNCSYHVASIGLRSRDESDAAHQD